MRYGHWGTWHCVGYMYCVPYGTARHVSVHVPWLSVGRGDLRLWNTPGLA